MNILKEVLVKPVSHLNSIVTRQVGEHNLILENIMVVSLGDNKIKLIGSDLDMQLSIVVSANGAGSFEKTTFNSKKFNEICKSVDDGKELVFTAKESSVGIKCGKSKFSIRTLNADSYPVMGEEKSYTTEFNIKQKDLKKLFSQVEYSIEQGHIKPILNGAAVDVKNGCINVVSTDGFRLSFSKFKLDENVSEAKTIVPKKAIREVCKLLGDNDNLVTVSINDSKIKFKIGEIELISKVISGDYVPYEKVIPNLSGYQNKVVVNTQELLESLKRVNVVLGDEKLKNVVLELGDADLKIIAGGDKGDNGEDMVKYEYSGEKLSVGFNIGFLLESLNIIESESCELHLAGANSSMVIKNHEAKCDIAKEYISVIMPMKI